MNSSNETVEFTTSKDWFSSGRRVHFDLNHKRIVPKSSSGTVSVFERVVQAPNSSRWLTLLPGFPDGSFGFAKVDHLLDERNSIPLPRLYIEYVGQGDSDKPKKKDYPYGTMERADLVEAQWKAHNVKKTLVVTFDYSSLVLMELLRRQQERPSAFPTKIEHVLIMNGGLFADGHTHPWSTTPLLKTPLGRASSAMAQRSNLAMNVMLSPLYSKSYRNSKTARRERRETGKAIRRHRGTMFLSAAAGFVDEHKKNADRWDLYNICAANHINTTTIHIVGSEHDPFEHKQIELARTRLHSFYPQVRTEIVPGGHLFMTEQAAVTVDKMEALLKKVNTSMAPLSGPSWTSLNESGREPISNHVIQLPSWTTLSSYHGVEQ